MTWRLAKSLETLRAQVNKAAPSRSKSSDGTIGDEAHASRSSDHNPHIREGKVGVVTALDVTHDPANGVDARKLAEALVASRDPRIKYIISNAQIISGPKGPKPWVWRKYSGSNPHTKHVHISVRGEKEHYDGEAPWSISVGRPIKTAEPKVDYPLLKKGSKGQYVVTLQKLLGVNVDGKFGPRTEEAVKKFQRSKKLVADGKVGDYTWEALLKTPENVQAANFLGGVIGGILLEAVAKPILEKTLEKTLETAGKAMTGKTTTKTVPKVAKEIIEEVVEEAVEKKVEKEKEKTSGQVDLGRYSKLIAALAGNVIGVALVWFAMQFPSVATCAVGPDGTDACTILGFTQAQITGFVMASFNTARVYWFPANKPPA
jgi:peptidoglycan hydrolase-like protein with peptidoglycan-binding domain